MRVKLNYMGPLVLLCSMIIACSNSKKMNSEEKEENSSTTNMELEIRHYQGICTGQDITFCMFSKDATMDDWDFHYGLIKGFGYEWGYNYIIEVEPLTENTGMADDAGGDLKYLKTISKTRVNPEETFEILLKDDGGMNILKSDDGEQYSLLDMVEVNMALTDPGQLNQLSDHVGRATGTFKHAQDKTNEITLVKINFN